MKTNTVTIISEYGLHARPASSLTKLANSFEAEVTISANGKSVNAKSILAVLTLDANQGTDVSVSAEGADEMDAVEAICQFLAENED